MTINGEQITEKEFTLFMDKQKSSVTTYFKIKYNADSQKGYWTKSFNGEVPVENLKTRAYTPCIESKVIQILAKKHKLIEDISFNTIVQCCNDYNQGQKKRNIVSGLGQYTIDNYYDYYSSNLKLQLEDKLGESILKVSDADINEYYNSHPNLYKNKNEVKIYEIYFPYNLESKKDNYNKAMQAKKMLDGGVEYSDVCEKYSLNGKARESSFILTDSVSQFKSNKEILEAVKGMSVGQYSDVIDQGNGYCIIKLLSQNKGSEYSLSDVSAQIKVTLMRQKFDEYVGQQIKKSVVVINQKVYQNIKVD